MIEAVPIDLERLAREAAEDAAGAEAVEQVEVVPGEDSTDLPAYRFSFLIDQSRAVNSAGLVRIKLLQALRDRLIARGDTHYPMVRILDRRDWPKRARA
jgi:hypothetical protein